MEVFAVPSRDSYLATQIARSEEKFGYCKVSIRDALNYRSLLPAARGPILCLGTRNGREVDLFRLAFFGPSWLAAGARLLETDRQSFRSRLPVLEQFGPSRLSEISERSSLGVELNPRGGRGDIWVGSFDDMPTDWAGRFGLVYSNSFDQSQDPERTAHEWRRVTRPGGYIVVAYAPDAIASEHDPVGGITSTDLSGLFGGRVVYESERGSVNHYSEFIIQR